MVGFWIFAGVAFILLGLFIFSQGGQNLGPAISLLGVVILLILLMRTAHAHDHGRPELDGWFKGLTSRARSLCCDGSDATRLDDVDWQTEGGRYRVRIYGDWVDVPEDAVIDGPNRAGPAMVWPLRGYGGISIRCFMPGTMT